MNARQLQGISYFRNVPHHGWQVITLRGLRRRAETTAREREHMDVAGKPGRKIIKDMAGVTVPSQQNSRAPRQR